MTVYFVEEDEDPTLLTLPPNSWPGITLRFNATMYTHIYVCVCVHVRASLSK